MAEEARTYTYTVILLKDPEEGGYTVVVPALPGCVTEGDDVDEALAMAQEAMECYLECVLADGEPAPEETDPITFYRDESVAGLFCQVTATPDPSACVRAGRALAEEEADLTEDVPGDEHTLRPATVLNILRGAGLSVDEFRRLLG